jgi:hypothetical protein
MLTTTSIDGGELALAMGLVLLRRRGEAGALDLRGMFVRLCLAGRVSRCGSCRHAGVICAESSLRAAEPRYLENEAIIMAVFA